MREIMTLIGVGSHFHWPDALIAKHGLARAAQRRAPDGLAMGDAALRIAVQKAQGLDAEIIVHSGYPVLPSDHGTRANVLRDFNTWLSGFTAPSAGRLVGIGELPLWDISAAVAEAKRMAGLGLRGVLIPTVPGRQGPWSPMAQLPYGDAAYRPLWEAMAAHGLVLVVHSEVPIGSSESLDLSAMVSMITARAMSSETATALIMGHVFRDYPALNLVCIESGVTWMDQTMEWLDNQAREHPRVFPGLTETPSALFRRHVFGTVAWDMTDSIAHKDFTSDNLMWSCDPPHHGADTMAQVSAIQAALAAQGRTRILADNAAHVFGLA